MIPEVVRAVWCAARWPLCSSLVAASLTAYLLLRLDQPGLALTAVCLPIAAACSFLMHELGHIAGLGSDRSTVVVRSSFMRVSLYYTSDDPRRRLLSALAGPLTPGLVGVLMLFSGSIPLLLISPVFLLHLLALLPPNHDSRTVRTECRSLITRRIR